MVVRLRLSRFGCKNKPFYRVMAADSRSPRDGKHLETLGYYNPLPVNSSMSLNTFIKKLQENLVGENKLLESLYERDLGLSKTHEFVKMVASEWDYILKE